MMNSVFKVIIGIFLLTVLSAQSTRAATFSLDFNEPTTITPMISYTSASGTVQENLVGSDLVDSFYKSPWDNTSTPDEEFTAVRRNSTAVYEFSETYTNVSFLWGSVDANQMIGFFLGDTAVDFLNSNDVLDAGATEGDGFVQIAILAAAFDTIKFMSPNNSFEIANLSVSAVPLPAALPLYAAGILVLGWVGRMRRVKR
ncbi:VPLPA-CTERM sorting domain-containing protein [Sneathiella limimaris]|uniref:VPLPA-CTERM sorting domain-containing protein n=1 Tax=Sneathiella limimaris TaxID=1964213 RepID=UPI00146C2405|nr:VPLPA-CTERM sorting domain-containing protein [Sneathiella limimaris]